MNTFIQKLGAKVMGITSGFDRLIFRGILQPITYADGMQTFLNVNHILLKEAKGCFEKTTEVVRNAALSLALTLGRPVEKADCENEKKSTIALALAQEQKMKEGDGLICILKAVEPCQSSIVL